jgi:hypothetical protein
MKRNKKSNNTTAIAPTSSAVSNAVEVIIVATTVDKNPSSVQSQQSTVKEPLLVLTVPDDSQDVLGVAKGDDVEKLLICPFIGGDRIELEAQGLDLCDFRLDHEDDYLITVQMEHCVARNHFQTLIQEDVDKLNPRTCVSNVIIGFWLLWICRNDFPSTSNVLMLSTHFYSTLLEEGEEEKV